jgi:hypothetical protein
VKPAALRRGSATMRAKGAHRLAARGLRLLRVSEECDRSGGDGGRISSIAIMTGAVLTVPFTQLRTRIATPYSISSSARNRKDSGMVRPSALAVFMLITSSNFTGTWTGRSLAFVPLRIRSA